MRPLFFILPVFTIAKVWAYEDPSGVFSGRIARLNTKTSLVRIKVDFSNFRYVNKRDQVEFWNEYSKSKRCFGHVVGKSDKYMLVKIPRFVNCSRNVNLSIGTYIKLFSQDLVNNLKIGRELIKTINKKRSALSAKLEQEQGKLSIHLEKIDTVNNRYKILRDKLEVEWRDEIKDLEEDQVSTLKRYKELQIRLNEIDLKRQQYRIDDENLYLDRWALDSHLYFKK